MNGSSVHGDSLEALIGAVEVLEVIVRHRTHRLARPFPTSRGTLTRRDVLHVAVRTLVDRTEVTGFGTAAPLRGWGIDTFEQARTELEEVASRCASGGPIAGDILVRSLRSASARFALSSALIGASARRRGIPLRRLLDPRARDSISVNATIGLVSVEQTVRQARAAISEGYSVIKLKVGSSVESDAERVAAVRAALPRAGLRLDANGAWSISEARTFLKRVSPHRIEYVEEPIALDDLDRLRELSESSAIPIAADESCLPLQRAWSLVERELVDVLVLKPALAGSWVEIADLVVAARRVGIKIVMTSALDTAAGQFVVAQFAAAMLPENVTCGLATAGLTSDATTVREEFVQDGRLYLSRWERGCGSGFGPDGAGADDD